MHDDSRDVELRLARFIRETVEPSIYRDVSPLTLEAYEVPGDGEPVPFAEVVGAPFAPFRVGTTWGAPWGTTWFRIRGDVPAAWRAMPAEEVAVELTLDLGFNGHRAGYQAEGLLYTPDGEPLKGVNPRNSYFRLRDLDAPVDFLLEAASNPDFDVEDFEFRPSPMGEKATAGAEPLYRFRQCALGLFDRQLWELAADIRVLRELAGELDATSQRRAAIVRAFEDMLDVVTNATAGGDGSIHRVAPAARAMLAPVLAMPATASAHSVVAVGHAHIDSAWLWPVRETIRKCSRTFSNALDLMEEDADFVFAASSAQQYAWMKDHHPAVFARMKTRIAEGRFVPVGGMWVESDTNLPGGEALVRQFLHGQRFFEREFGRYCEEVWLPDSFGYTGSLPQIARQAGMRWMLTQKMSWSRTNAFPHHTFLWQGIDGSRIFTHLPPVDTYGAEMTAAELAHASANFREKGRANRSLVPFGYGDGGGGPNREMLAAVSRLRSLEGSPTVGIGTPRGFFEAAEAEYAHPPVWSGEMYLESHRGTYTTQAETKRGNRRSEHLLREAELWAATAAVRAGEPYPAEELAAIWQQVLLLQFHDILPGSSIGWVHREAESVYAGVAERLEALIAHSLDVLAGAGEVPLVANPAPLAIGGVPGGGIGSPAEPVATAAALPTRVDVDRRPDGSIRFDTPFLSVTTDPSGQIASLLERASGREMIASGQRANALHLHVDTPSEWDAWDIDRHYLGSRRGIDDVRSLDVVEAPDGSATLVVTRAFGDSVATQRMRVDPDSSALTLDVAVDWHERQKMLKLSFPMALRSERAATESQFGHTFRATHENTTWDFAQFEIPAQRWVHIEEAGCGVSLANESSYGYDVGCEVLPDHTWATTIRASLLRAPLYPDPQADQGPHRFRFTLRAGTGIADAIADGYALNLPQRRFTGAHPVEPLVTVQGDGVLVESVKLAEDGSGDVVVRSYEALGGHRAAVFTPAFPVGSISAVDLLERPVTDVALTASGAGRQVAYRPFQIVTLRFARR